MLLSQGFIRKLFSGKYNSFSSLLSIETLIKCHISWIVLKPSSSRRHKQVDLEAFPVDDGWARFVVFLLADPHLLEGGERSQDGSSDPDEVFPLWWSNDLDLHGWWGEGGDLLLHTIGDTWEHGRTPRQDGISVQVLTDIDVAFHDGVVGGFVDTCRFHTDEGGLEEGLGASESLVSNGDDLSIGKLVGFLQA